jgi:hypothetical protein
MQLVVHGRIVRSRGGEIAVRMVQHEFRTVGMPANHSDAPSKAADTSTPFLTAVNGGARFAKVQ